MRLPVVINPHETEFSFYDTTGNSMASVAAHNKLHEIWTAFTNVSILCKQQQQIIRKYGKHPNDNGFFCCATNNK